MDNRADYFKESALGWLKEADHDDGTMNSREDMLAAAQVHALLYVGDQIRELGFVLDSALGRMR